MNELITRVRESRAALEQVIGSLSSAQMTTPRGDSQWSVKDHLAHLTAWERFLLLHLQGHLEREHEILRALAESQALKEYHMSLQLLEQIYKRLNRQAAVGAPPDRLCSLAACPAFLNVAVEEGRGPAKNRLLWLADITSRVLVVAIVSALFSTLLLLLGKSPLTFQSVLANLAEGILFALALTWPWCAGCSPFTSRCSPSLARPTNNSTNPPIDRAESGICRPAPFWRELA